MVRWDMSDGPRPAAPVRWHVLAIALLFAALLLPAVPLLLDLPRYGALQYNDYYGNLAQVLDHRGGEVRVSADPVRWLLIKSNEHTVTLPTLCYAANWLLTGGDNRGLSFLSILLGLAVATGVTLLLLRAFGLRPLCAPPLGFAASAMVFSPASAHSYVMGFSGSIWVLTNALCVAAMVVLFGRPREGRPGSVSGALLCAVLAAMSYTTSMSVWPALLLGLWFLGGRRRQLAATAAVAGLVALAQWLVRARPDNHPDPSADPLQLVHYLGVYLGWPVTPGSNAAAALVGLLAATAAVAALLACGVLRWRRTALHPGAAAGAMLVVYGLGNGLGTAIGRSGFGVAQASSSRYASLALLFWMGLLVLLTTGVAVAARRRRWPGRPGTVLPLAAAALLVAGTHRDDRGTYRSYLDRAAWNDVAAVALRHGVFVDRTVLGRINNAPDQFAHCRRWLQTLDHVPFAGPRTFGRRSVLDPELLEERTDELVQGRFDLVEPLGEGIARVQGWAFATRGRIDEAVLLDETGAICGELVMGSPRPDVARSLGAERHYSGISGYVLREPRGSLRVHVRLRGEETFSPIAGAVHLSEEAQAELASDAGGAR